MYLVMTEQWNARGMRIMLWHQLSDVLRNPTPDDSLGFTWEPVTEDNMQHLVLTPSPAMEPDQRQKVGACSGWGKGRGRNHILIMIRVRKKMLKRLIYSKDGSFLSSTLSLHVGILTTVCFFSYVECGLSSVQLYINFCCRYESSMHLFPLLSTTSSIHN